MSRNNLGYLRQPCDFYVCFRHVNYYKNIHIHGKLVAGYAFNQKHFHASDCVTTVVLWEYGDEDAINFDLPVFDIVDGSCQEVKDSNNNLVVIHIQKCTLSINESSNSYDKTLGIETSVVCGADGYPIEEYQYKKNVNQFMMTPLLHIVELQI